MATSLLAAFALPTAAAVCLGMLETSLDYHQLGQAQTAADACALAVAADDDEAAGRYVALLNEPAALVSVEKIGADWHCRVDVEPSLKLFVPIDLITARAAARLVPSQPGQPGIPGGDDSEEPLTAALVQ